MNEAELRSGLPETPKYKYAERVGDQLFVAGQVPHDADGRLTGPGDVSAQTRQCLKNLVRVLSVHGFDQTDIRRIIIYVVGEQSDLSAAWTTVVDWFDGLVPPATLLGVARLGHDGQLVEIDSTIVKSPDTP